VSLNRGIYCLILRVPECTIGVGALGKITFRAGWYTYIGSALGSGGFARVRRHIRVNREGTPRPHWHIDHLLSHPGVRLHRCICAETGRRLECELARSVGGEAVEGFGCSDCRCRSHLHRHRSDPTSYILGRFTRLGLDPVTQQSSKGIAEDFP